jgi:hypothetical protein
MGPENGCGQKLLVSRNEQIRAEFLLIVGIVKKRWAGHVAGMGKGMHIRYWWESQKERDY